MTSSFRVEHDSMGEVKVPAEALWGAHSQRAVQNFPVSGLTMPRAFIAALGLLHQPERGDEGSRHGEAAYGEVLHRALGVRAPQRLRRHLDLAHAVMLHPEGTRHARTPLTARAARVGSRGPAGRLYALSC